MSATMYPVRKICWGMFLVLSLTGCNGAQSPTNSATVAKEKLAASWQTPMQFIDQLSGSHAEIIYSNDLLGQSHATSKSGRNRYGGLAARRQLIAARRQQLTASGQHLLVVDAGNTLFDHRGSNKTNALAMASELTTMGLDAMALGENELAAGLPYLQEIVSRTALPLLSSNIVAVTNNERTLFERHRIIKQGKMSFGVFSLIAPEFLHPHQTTLADLGYRIEPPQETTARELNYLRTQKVDLIVLLAHLPWDQLYALTDRFPNLGIIVAGHGNRRTEVPENRQGNVILQAGDHGHYLGMLKAVIRNPALTSTPTFYDGTEWISASLKMARFAALPPRPNNQPQIIDLKKTLDQQEAALLDPAQQNKNLVFNLMILQEEVRHQNSR